MRNVLTEMIEEFGQTDEQPEELPEFQELRVEKKRFYFDCGSNDRGSFVRISEVTNRYDVNSLLQLSILRNKELLHWYKLRR